MATLPQALATPPSYPLYTDPTTPSSPLVSALAGTTQDPEAFRQQEWMEAISNPMGGMPAFAEPPSGIIQRAEEISQEPLPPDPNVMAGSMDLSTTAAASQRNQTAYNAMASYNAPGAKPPAVLSPGEDPTWREKLKDLGMQAGMTRREVESFLGGNTAPGGIGVLDVLPGTGMATAAVDAAEAAAQGDVTGAAMAAMGAVPGGKAAKAVSPALSKAVKGADVGLGAFKTTTPGRILNESNKGGYSVHVPTGERPESGLFSGIYANADPRNTVISGRKATRGDVLEAFKKNKKVMQQKNKFFGGWKDDQGTMYLEPSQRFEEDRVREATKFAERTKQKKIFRRSDFAELPVGDWEEFVKSDEFVDKLIRMGREGRTATEAAAGPGVEWWDLPVLDEVYGPYAETARKFLATTSANATPAENVRKMTEYMRRWLKKEEIVQPNFRVPETATHFTPGTQMGLEESLVPNLLRSAKGEPLSGPSVGGKDRVMNRPSADPLDPRDYVPDRRWARIAEKPEAGVFTSGTEGVIRDEEQVTKIGEAIARAAQAEGRSVRNLSADVWFALNPTETAQPYNKLIEDAIAQKAPTMGMTVKQFKDALGRGNAELLSVLLGTPALAAVAAQVLPSSAFSGEEASPAGGA